MVTGLVAPINGRDHRLLRRSAAPTAPSRSGGRVAARPGATPSTSTLRSPIHSVSNGPDRQSLGQRPGRQRRGAPLTKTRTPLTRPSAEAREPQQTLFSWAEFMAEKPVKLKGRGRKAQPATAFLFDWRSAWSRSGRRSWAARAARPVQKRVRPSQIVRRPHPAHPCMRTFFVARKTDRYSPARVLPAGPRRR